MLDVNEIRSHFPSLGSGAVFFDNPGGSQVPKPVGEAMLNYFNTANANVHGAFDTSRRTDETITGAREAMRDFLNSSSPDEIVFGANMTTLTFHLARSLSRDIKPGDEVVVTRMDHDANIAPWLDLEEQGAVIKWVSFHPEDCTLNMEELEDILSDKTKLVAVGYASNAVGTINDLKRIVTLAHQHDALVYIDAVHYAPHGPIDVQDLDCDFLVCSPYKFYGPHMGVLYGKRKWLERLKAHKVRPSEKKPPEKFETGTQNHEALAGLTATLNFLSDVGEKYGEKPDDRTGSLSGRPLNLKRGMTVIRRYESELFNVLLEGIRTVPGIKVYGITDRERMFHRTPTLAFTSATRSPRDISIHLGKNDIYVWDGNYYALALMEWLGLEETGGAVRVGLAFYNTPDEIQRFLEVLRNFTA